MSSECVIFLTRGYEARVSPEDRPALRTRRWRAHVSNSNGKVYARASCGAYMHRIITECPPTLKVDHVNGDTLDNRRANLRVTNHEGNNANRRGFGESGFKGVYRVGGRWRARVTFQGCETHIGYFGSAKEAAHAYDEAALRLFGAFTWLNFPRSPDPVADNLCDDIPF